jgi:hypothetical protein
MTYKDNSSDYSDPLSQNELARKTGIVGDQCIRLFLVFLCLLYELHARLFRQATIDAMP